MLKKFLFVLLAFLNVVLFSMVSYSADSPSFSDVVNDNNNNLFSGVNISKNDKLYKNLKKLFLPSITDDGGILFKKILKISVGLLFLFLVRAGVLFLFRANDEGELKKAKMNILYIFYATFLIFGASYILGNVLNIGEDTNVGEVTVALQNDVIGKILVFLKAFAFYAAIILVIYYGYRIMQAQEKEDKIKSARSGILNVIIALVAIKVLDYVYYIAQNKNFGIEASNFISSAGTVLAWILGVVIIIVLIYAGILLISSRGNEEAMKKTKKIITNIFLVIFVLFLFLILVFDLIKNFSS